MPPLDRLHAGDINRAWSAATVVTAITRRPFLPGSHGPWVDRQRRELHGMLVRALDCLTKVWLASDDLVLAVRLAEEAVALEPYRGVRLPPAHDGPRPRRAHSIWRC